MCIIRIIKAGDISSEEIKALLNIVTIGKNTKRETKIIINQMLPTIKLSPFNQPRDDKPCVI